jgi:hypothetical protein
MSINHPKEKPDDWRTSQRTCNSTNGQNNNSTIPEKYLGIPGKEGIGM